MEHFNGKVSGFQRRELRPHAAEGRLFLVAGGLALLEAGLALAGNDAAAVQAWIASRQLVRPMISGSFCGSRAGWTKPSPV